MILLLKSYPYHFVRTILSIPLCPIPFCPYTILFIPFCPRTPVCDKVQCTLIRAISAHLLDCFCLMLYCISLILFLYHSSSLACIFALFPLVSHWALSLQVPTFRPIIDFVSFPFYTLFSI